MIDADSEEDLQTALGQLAGGMSKPLLHLREKLLFLVAELEAGLDFVDEDIEFISNEQLRADLQEVHAVLVEVISQLQLRADSTQMPRVVLVGKPNVGKSSLFNALVQRYATGEKTQQVLVADQSGTTRDFVTVKLSVGETDFELVDTAGIDQASHEHPIDQVAQQLSQKQWKQAALAVYCQDTSREVANAQKDQSTFVALTKCDLLNPQSMTNPDQLPCSSISGHGIKDLAEMIAKKICESEQEASGVVGQTAMRCRSALQMAEASTSRALQLVEVGEGEELIAAELREALHAIGQVVGQVYTDDILDRIFGQFCIGK